MQLGRLGRRVSEPIWRENVGETRCRGRRVFYETAQQRMQPKKAI